MKRKGIFNPSSEKRVNEELRMLREEAFEDIEALKKTNEKLEADIAALKAKVGL